MGTLKMSMKNINLSEWALKNQPLVKYFLLILFVAGIWAYSNLNKREDPDFTIKTMMVKEYMNEFYGRV